MTIQPNCRADSGETSRLLTNYSSSSTSVNVLTSTKATNSLSDLTLSDNKTEPESILHDSVDPVPRTNLGLDVLPTQSASEQFQGFCPHRAVALPLPLSAMIVLRNRVRQVLSANTAVSVVCLVLYQAMLPTLQMRTRILIQSTLWAVVPFTHRCLHNGYLPLVLLSSIAMAWIWYETYLGCTASFAVHSAVGEPVPDSCPHGSTACQALFGMVVTTVMSALCFAAEIGLFWYIEHGPHGNMWLQDGDEGLMANFLRGYSHEELVQCLRNAEGHVLQNHFATQDQFMTEMFPIMFVAQIPVHAQFVGVGSAQVSPVPVVSASHASHMDYDFFSDEETLADDESFQSSESAFLTMTNEGDDDGEDGVTNDEVDSDDDESEDSEKDSEEEDEYEQSESRPPGLAPTSDQEMEEY
ncbi:hypothetical protein BGZ81_006143 [Podila clonocystis]|nr:hypothetical protein BGZ81_006143 [Podila clonocystis]